MVIKIDMFEFPTKEEMAPLLKEGPLYNYVIDSKLFHWTNQKLSGLDRMDNLNLNRNLVSSLNKRVFQLNFSYAYLLYYSHRGIPDGELPYLKNLTDQEWTNKVQFDQNADSLFQKAFTSLDLLAHLLFACLGLKTERKRKGKLIKIKKSFHSAMLQIQIVDSALYNKLEEIRSSVGFQEASKVRNDIIHNQPPYEKRTQIVEDSEDGTISVVVQYTPSKRLLEIALGLLECMKRICEIIEGYFNEKITCS
ncbi:Cthe_2314 family HEPN domain-containing protein [Bacillus mycoides]|uniref:Cthe_2314 family HEPN domain-containing protein n=1 Tax=Bacillus mycoides TaxID=1405 RepID=UPI003D653B44